MASNVLVYFRVRFLAACWLCLTGAASAQAPAPPAASGGTPGIETNSGPIIPFLEGTEVFTPLRNDVVFEADIFPHLVAFQNFADVIDLDKQDEEGVQTMGVVISGTPAVRLRMFEERSRPVRTPSYMPRGNFQFIWAGNVREVVQVARTTAAARAPAPTLWLPLFEAHAIIGHHSNGQNGCTFDDEVLIESSMDEADECVLKPTADPGADPADRPINTTDGSFSTNYIRTGVNFRQNRLDDTLRADLEWGVRADFEYHPRAWVDDDIVDIYGRARTEVAASFAAREIPGCRKRLDLSGSLKFIAGRPDDVSPRVYLAQASCFPFRKGGWGFFVRYYHGEDYYNQGFRTDIERVHVGATFNQTGFFRFRRSNREQLNP